MEMYEERPPEIFTGGYFDQAMPNNTASCSQACSFVPVLFLFVLYAKATLRFKAGRPTL